MSFGVAIVQFKPRKGDVAANFAALRGVFAQLIAGPAELPRLIVLPEAAMTGYFLEGAVYELSFSAPDFAAKLDAEWRAAGGTAEIDVVCGFYENREGTYHNSALYATLGGNGPRVVHVHRKMFLPTYGVFDEERFLSRGRHLGVFPTPFGTAAILICEDAWHSIMPTIAALKGARLIIVPSASPGRGLAGSGMLESVERWRATATLMASEHGVYVLYAGLTGFEGGKGHVGRVVHRLAARRTARIARRADGRDPARAARRRGGRLGAGDAAALGRSLGRLTRSLVRRGAAVAAERGARCCRSLKRRCTASMRRWRSMRRSPSAGSSRSCAMN